MIGGTSNFGQITQPAGSRIQRGYNWEYSASVQHELMPRLSITVGYPAGKFYNLDVIDNQNVGATEWNPFTS